MKTEREAYERGKRHLANMMGEDPATFTQEDIDVSNYYFLFKNRFFNELNLKSNCYP